MRAVHVERATRKIWMELNEGEKTPEEGHYLVTVTKRRKGSAYVIVGVRRVKRRDPAALPRYNLAVQPIERTPEIERLAEWWIRWHAREKRRRS